MMMSRRKVVGYIRVSTERQAEEGAGLEVQERAIRKFAKDQGFVLVEVLRDEGVSGTLEAAKRPGLQAAIKALRAGQASGLIVHRLDRLARVLHVQEATFALAWRAGAAVFSVDSGEIRQDDPDDPMRTAIRQMMGVFAQLDRSTVTQRLRQGKAVKKAAGAWVGGVPSYGMRAEDKSLRTDAGEAAAVALIRQLRKGGTSYRDICKALEDGGHRPRRAASWKPETVRRIAARTS